MGIAGSNNIPPIREGIITVSFEQLEVYLHALYAVLLADINEETLFQMAVTYG
jgi:hypothetical protein